jgi:serine protease Do
MALRCPSPSRLRFLFVFIIGFSLIVVGSGGVAAGEPAKSSLPAAFSKEVPEGPKDLLDIQKHVQALVKKLQPATVGVRIGQAQGSGVIVTKDGYVLTAGHVSGKAERDARIILADGRTLKAKTLGRNGGIDSGLLKITEEAEFPFIEMGNSGDLKKGDWCLAIGHPGGVKPGRTPVVRFGRVLDSNKTLIRTDCTLVGGDSGGPLFDMHGKVIGIHSRIGGLITYNIHVPVDTYTETWDRLAASEEWGIFPFGNSKPADVYMGVVLDFDNKDKAGKITMVAEKSPAERAGLMVDDVLIQLDGKKVSNQQDVNNILYKKQPNDEIALQIQRGDETLTIKLKLEKRPSNL